MINTIKTEIPTIFFILSFLKIIVNSIIIDNTDPTSAAALPRDCGNLWEPVRFCKEPITTKLGHLANESPYLGTPRGP